MARIATSCLFLSSLFEVNGQIFYPSVASVNDFHVGDKLVVDLANPYKSARLLLYCSYEENPRVIKTLPSHSTSPITLTLTAPPSPNCYLEIIQDSNTYVTSPIFSVSKSNGTERTWSSDSQSEGRVSPAAVSSAVAQAPAVSSAPSSQIPRPNVTLPDDGPDSAYVLPDGKDCLNLTRSSLAEGCWEALNLALWLPQWFKETKKCAPRASSDINCQSQDPVPEAWTSTFLREYGSFNPDCLHLHNVPYSCNEFHSPPATPDEAPLLTARFEYVKVNIFAIAGYFYAWHSALEKAAMAAESTIDPIIKLIDIQTSDKSHIAINVFLTVLGVALSFIPVIGPEAGLGTLTVLAANAAISGVKLVPDMAKKLWPTGAKDTIDFQTEALTEFFTNGLLPSLDQNFGDLLSIVQGLEQPDTASFLAFANQGIFSAPSVQGPAAGATSDVEQGILRQSMTTFLVSETLSQNGWQALLVPGVDAEGLHNGDKACPEWARSECNDDRDVMGCYGHDYSGRCYKSYWWYSLEHNSMYTLIHDGEQDKKATDFLKGIFDAGWSTGPLLFENAAKCELQNLLQTAQIQDYIYVNASGQGAGFLYSSQISALPAEYQTQQGSNFFLPIAGTGLVELSKLSNVHDAQYHPISEPFAVQTTGVVDQSCVSNLNVTIATSWGNDNWQGNNS